jgi:hypothetical protein
VDTVWIGTPDGAQRATSVRVLTADGARLDEQAVVAGPTPTAVAVDAGPARCQDAAGVTIDIVSDGPVVAQALDRALGLTVVPGRPPSTTTLLGGLPRDRFATRISLVRVAVHNPSVLPARVTLRLLGDAGGALRTTGMLIAPGATRYADLPAPSHAAVLVRADAPVVAAGIGWMPTGTWSLPQLGTGPWILQVPSDSPHEAGVWLTVANPSAAEAVVVVDDPAARESRIVRVCAVCAHMIHLPAVDESRLVTVRVNVADARLATVSYSERTASRHFDPGLPLLAAAPVALAGWKGALVVPALLTVALAVGVWQLLGRCGVAEPSRSVGALAVTLLAPVSPYGVRLYTEMLAAALVVWALVCWDTVPRRRVLYPVLLAIIVMLPIVHGRYASLSIVLVLLIAARLPADSRRRALAFGAIAGGIALALLLAAPIGLWQRASLDYFSPEWAAVSSAGVLLDRGSGLVPFAPWLLLALASGRRMHPVQRAALLLSVTLASVVLLREGGWQTWGAPGRYLLPVAPLLGLLAVPGAIRLWATAVGRSVVVVAVSWSVAATVLLHWLPLAGYARKDQYLIDDAFRGIPGPDPLSLFPQLPPSTAQSWLGVVLLAGLWIGLLWLIDVPVLVSRARHPRRTGANST